MASLSASRLIPTCLGDTQTRSPTCDLKGYSGLSRSAWPKVWFSPLSRTSVSVLARTNGSRNRRQVLSALQGEKVECPGERRDVTDSKGLVTKLSKNAKEDHSRDDSELGRKALPLVSCLAALCIAISASVGVAPAEARRPEGVNKPELLPKEFTRVIDVAGFLTAGQEARLSRDLERLEEDTGFKLRVLAQNYPETPGLAIRDYWGVDDQTVVFVADPSLSGNIINFNVGATVDLSVPRSFWSRVAGKYGNMFYWRENGEDSTIEAAVFAIDACLREPPGPRQCAEVK